eukprot:6311741-Amphidinium_carterae.1
MTVVLGKDEFDRDWGVRPTLPARDPLVCVKGFRTLRPLGYVKCTRSADVPELPTLRHISVTQSPCAHASGSNATLFGGVLGRVDAVHGAFECQRGVTLHMVT